MFISSKNHTCDQCSKSFSHNGNLQLHQMTHSMRKQNIPSKIHLSEEFNTDSVKTELEAGVTNIDEDIKHEKIFLSKTKEKQLILTENKVFENYISDKNRPIIKCKECELTFARKYSLKQHMLSHTTKEWPYQCNSTDCNTYYETSSKLKYHNRRMHSIVIKSKICIICKKGLHNDRDLERHILTHDESKRNNIRYLPRNMMALLNVNGIIEFEKRQLMTDCICHKCGKIFEIVHERNRHIRHVHERKYKCATVYCAKSFSSEQSLQQHMLQKVCNGDGTTFKCDQCEDIFPILDALKDHFKKHVIKPYICDNCKERFTSIEHLEIHQIIHSQEIKLDCDSCEQSFEKEYLYLKHKRIDHGIESQSFICSVCGKKCVSNSDLKDHSYKHTKVKGFNCNTCGKAFKRQRILDLHMRSHTGDKTYLCNECESRYFTLSALRNHEKTKHRTEEHVLCTHCGISKSSKAKLLEHITIHTGEKKHTCTTCEKKFRTRDCLTRHEKIHIGIKEFQCQHCEKLFMQRDHLKRHTAIHTGVRRHVCPGCKKHFIDPGDVRKHMKIHHKNIEYKKVIID